MWALNHWNFPKTKKKYPGPTAYTCLPSVDQILSCLLFGVESGIVLFCLDDTWTMVDFDSVRVRTAWLDSCFSRIFWIWSKQHACLLSLVHSYWPFIYPQAQLCWGENQEKRREKKKKKKSVWMGATHPQQLMRNEGAIRRSPQHNLRYYTTCLYIYTTS